MGYEVNSVMNIKDKNGNNNTIYPVTKKENVIGLLESLNELSESISSASSAVSALAGTVAGKVDKVAGKGLSTNDFTDKYKANLDSLDTALDAKADASDLTATQNQLNSLNDEISALSTTVAGKASTSDVTSLATTVGGKADTTYVNTELAKKVNKETGKGLSTNDYTTAEKNKLAGIAEGANKTTVDSALSSTSTNPVQNKAVNTALSSKLETFTFNSYKTSNDTAVGNKADKTYVDNELAKKADSSALTSKADASTVSAISDRVSATETEQETLSARMDEFTKLKEGSTTGDAELADGRVGADGKTYDNIGGAIRGQVTDLKSDLVNNTNSYAMNFTQGKYINTNMDNVDVSNLLLNQYWEVCIENCVDGDRFIINGLGGVENSLWCFIDGENNVISRAYENINVNNYYITAPKNAKKIIINRRITDSKCYKNITVDVRLNGVKEDFKTALFNFVKSATISTPSTTVHGYGLKGDGTVISANYAHVDKHKVKPSSYLYVEIDSTLDGNFQFAKDDNAGNYTGIPSTNAYYGLLKVPSDAQYLMTCYRDNENQPKIYILNDSVYWEYGTKPPYWLIMLDIADKYFSINNIKNIIDKSASAGINMLMLNLSNNGFRLELDDMIIKANGTEYDLSPTLGHPLEAVDKWYTQSEMDTIISYANDKGIELVPCFDMPGHMNRIRQWFGDFIRSDTIDLESQAAINFAYAIADKYSKYFSSRGCKYWNIGCDEIIAGENGFEIYYTTNRYHLVTNFVNGVSEIVKKNGMIPMVWNDGVNYHNDYNYIFDKDIIVLYWTKENENISDATTLQRMGYKLVNANLAYYWVLGDTNNQVSIREFEETNLLKYFRRNILPHNSYGSAFCIWCKNVEDYYNDNGDYIVTKITPLIEAYGNAIKRALVN